MVRIRSLGSTLPVRRKAVALGLVVAWLAAPSAATTVRPVSVGEMVQRAALVVEAKVLAVETRAGASRASIQTCVTFDVRDLLKGTPPANPFELCFAGGKAGGIERRVLGMVYPELGETGIYFVHSFDRRLRNPLYGWHQGHFRVRVLPGGSGPVVTTAHGEVVTDVQADELSSPPTTRAARGIRVRAPQLPGSGASGGRVAQGPAQTAPAIGGMSPNAFKARLRALLGASQP